MGINTKDKGVGPDDKGIGSVPESVEVAVAERDPEHHHRLFWGGG